MTFINALQTPIPPPPSVSMPVYSLVAVDPTASAIDSKSSMNIVTFATLVSVKPRLYMISLYHGTRTKDTFLSAKYGVLQLLSRDQKDLVIPLGKRSGYEDGYEKDVICSELGYEWTTLTSFKSDLKDLDNNEVKAKECFDKLRLLPKCQSYIKVKVINTMNAGDHEMALCEVLDVGKWDKMAECVVNVDEGENIEPKDEKDALYTGYLRSKGII